MITSPGRKHFLWAAQCQVDPDDVLQKELEDNAVKAAKELKLERELADAKLKVREEIKNDQENEINKLTQEMKRINENKR